MKRNIALNILICLVAIGCITFLVWEALQKGVDGVALATGIAVIGAIVGVKARDIKEMLGKK